MPWLSTASGSSPSVIAPIRMGASIAAEARSIPALTSASRNGSTAVEFSGQTTRSGASTSPARTWAARSIVASTWLRVTSRCTATRSSPDPGTSPCTTAIRMVASSSTCHGTTVPHRVSASRPAATGAAWRSGGRSLTHQARAAPVPASSRLSPVKPSHGRDAAHQVSATV